MDGFSYTNIFETKGIEYIAIIVFFLALIPFWMYLIKSPAMKRGVQNVINFFSFEKLRIPQGVFYDKNHTWTYLEKNGTAAIGADDFLVQLTGAVNLKTLKKPGDTVKKGEPLAEAEKDGKKLILPAPVSGIIQKSNEALKEMPQLLTEDPYGKGWIYKVKPSDWKQETQDHYVAEDALDWSKNEVTRFKDFLAESMAKNNPQGAPVLQDGGELAGEALAKMPDNVWNDFQKEFLTPAL